MNSRRYPRSSTEAFPRTTDYACAVERPAPVHPHDKLIGWSSFAAAVACAVILVVWG